MSIKIYLAGKMSGLTYKEMNEWRENIKRSIQKEADLVGLKDKVCVINPVDYYNFEKCRHQTESEVEDYDLAHVKSSDIIVVNLERLDSSDGTKIELHDANYNNRIPVIAFGERQLYENLHPWVKRNITRVEEDENGVINYIRDFYMI